MADVFHIACFQGYLSTRPYCHEPTWDDLKSLLVDHTEREEKDGPLFSPVRYKPGTRRANASVEALSCFVLEFDDGAVPGELTAGWERWEYVVYSSHSHTPEGPRWRVVFPLAEPVPAGRWSIVYKKLSAALGRRLADKACCDPSRMYYFPACKPGAEHFAYVHSGEQLDEADFPDPEPEKIVIPPRRTVEQNGRVKTNLLLAHALRDLAEGRNVRAMWLACQLRDNGYTQAESTAVLEDYARHVPATNAKGDRFTEAEALEVLRKAYLRPAREPWQRLVRVEPPPEVVEQAPEVVDEALPEALPEGEEPPALDEALMQDLENTLEGKRPGKKDEPPSELILARRWAREVRSEFAFFEGSQWWEYAGGKWSYSSTEQAEAEVQRFMERLRFNGVDVPITATKVSSVLKLARPHLGVHKVSELNACSTFIPLRNGVYDSETGRLLPHDPKYFLTNQLPFDYEAGAVCPRWMRFLEEVMLTTKGAVCQEWIEALQEWFGYSLAPDNSAQVSMVWVGEGRNGKGVAARTLESLLGPSQCCAVPVEQLHDPYHRAELQGKLVGFVNEPDPRAMHKNGAYFKAITGGDTISARRPTEKVFSFVPFCRLVISTNSVPGTRDLSHGYFRRLLIVEWRRNFSTEDADPHLDMTLRKELPGIFNWAIEGLRRFRERGSKFAELKESEKLLAAYRLSEDPLGQFILEECEQHINHGMWFKDLYDGYRLWIQAGGYRDFGTKNAFGRRLDRLGTTSEVKREGDRVGAYRKGIRISEDSEFHPERLATAKEAGKTKLKFG